MFSYFDPSALKIYQLSEHHQIQHVCPYAFGYCYNVRARTFLVLNGFLLPLYASTTHPLLISSHPLSQNTIHNIAEPIH